MCYVFNIYLIEQHTYDTFDPERMCPVRTYDTFVIWWHYLSNATCLKRPPLSSTAITTCYVIRNA